MGGENRVRVVAGRIMKGEQQIAVRVHQRGVVFERALEMDQRRVDPTLILEAVGQVVVCAGEGGQDL